MPFIFVVSFAILACIVVDTANHKGRGRPAKCKLPPDDGPCRARIPSYYFDRKTKTCKEFMYGGCEGNENNFENITTCQEECRAKKV
uniref:Kunitz-type anticoagulant protein Ir-CPI n=1 Tax=Ixodes ricinus TaxID=34613 RepID=IRCPI_IXORI|nr:hypothetical protein [Ixodes ricinus]